MATASRSLATALWRARFASGLPRPSYTTNGDTTPIDMARRRKSPPGGQASVATLAFDFRKGVRN